MDLELAAAQECWDEVGWFYPKVPTVDMTLFVVADKASIVQYHNHTTQ